MEIKIYGSNECPYCNKLKSYLSILRIKYDYIDVDLKENESEYFSVVKETNNTFIPVVKMGEKLYLPERDFNTIPEMVKKIFIFSKKGG